MNSAALSNDPDAVIVRESKKKNFMAMMAGAALICIGYLTVSERISSAPFPRVMGWLPLAFGALVAAGSLIALRKSSPWLIVDHEGIYVLGLKVRRIPWHRIKNLRLVEISQRTFALVELDSFQGLSPTSSPLTNRVMKMFQVPIRENEILVAASGFSPLTAEEAIQLINERRERLGMKT